MPFPVRTTAPKPSDTRLDFLDGMRAVAALFVLVHHCYIQVWSIFEHRYPAGTLGRLSGWVVYGHFAVSFFIVISGFCLMLPVARGDGTLRGGARTFFKKRARRILPTYYFALAFSIAMSRLGTSAAVPCSVWGIASHILLIHNLSRATAGSINGAFWSIAVEWQIYFLFPLLVAAWTRAGAWPVILATVAAAYGASFFLLGGPLTGLTPHYIALFVFGMLAAAIAFSPTPQWTAGRTRAPWRILTAASAALLTLWCTHWGWEVALGPRQAQSDLLAGLAAAALLVLATRPSGRGLNRMLSARPLAFIGTFAYSIYLVHLPLVLASWRFLVQPLNLGSNSAFALLVLGCGPLILGLAYLFHLACERPFLSRRTASR